MHVVDGTQDAPGRLSFRADIEGLRGLAVLLVVAFHARLPFVSGGFVGVDVFFVISGYLITTLLTDEIRRTGTVSLPSFFARRMRRLLPAAAVVSLATLVLSAIVSPPLEMIETAASARAAAGYVSNVHFMWRAFGYFTGHATSNPLLHTWSLAVEEQFYVVWPLLLLGVSRLAPRRFDRRRLAWTLTAVAMASLVAASWYTTRSHSIAFYAMPLRAWEFAAGGLVSFAALSMLSKQMRVALGWVGLALIVAASATYTPATEFPGIAALLPVGGTAMLLVAGSGLPIRALSSDVMQWIGKRSYSWYLWHWPVLVLGASVITDAGTVAHIALAALSLVLAMATYRFVETPTRKMRRAVVQRPWSVIRLGLAATVLTMLSAEAIRLAAVYASTGPSQRAFTAAATDVAQPHLDGCVNDTDDDRVRVCVYGSPLARRVIALFGDSHAAQWFPALDTIAKARNWTLLVVAKTRCATADVPVYTIDTKTESASCRRWRAAATDTLRHRRAALVVLSNTLWYVRGPRLPADLPAVSVDVWQHGMVKTLDALHAAGIPALLIRDTPLFDTNVPVCLARSGWLKQMTNACATERAIALNTEVFAAEQRAAAAVPGTRVVDLTDHLCDAVACEPMVHGIVAYSDNEHLTSAMARQLAPLLEPALR